AFLSEQTQDCLFVVPAANLHQHHKQLCREYGVQVLTLDVFAATGELGLTKLVLTVAGDELSLLVTTFFARPQRPEALQDRGRHLPGGPSREAPLTDPGDMDRLRLEAGGAESHRQQPERERVVGPMPGAVVQHFQGRVHELSLLRQYLADENVRLVWV